MKLALNSTKKHQFKKTFVKPTSRFSLRDISVCVNCACSGIFLVTILKENYHRILQQSERQQMRKVTHNVIQVRCLISVL